MDVICLKEDWWNQDFTVRNIAFLYRLYEHGKNGFAERSKILAGYRKVILLNYQNNYVERSN